MIKNNDVPSKEGLIKYDKNAEHIKSFSGKYRPLIIFTNKNCQADELLDFLISDKKSYVEKSNIAFNDKSTMEIRTILSNKICNVVIIEDHTEKELQDIIDILNYYTYSAILFHSRKNVIEKNNDVWLKLKKRGVCRAVLCEEDLYKGNVDLFILRKITNYLHLHLPIDSFTYAKNYGIIKRVNNDENHVMNTYFISNIHIN